MTPVQLGRHFDGVQARELADFKRELTLAWHGAAFSRAQRLPRLQTLLDRIDRTSRPRDSAPQSMQEMVAAAKAWTKALGGTIRKKDPSR